MKKTEKEFSSISNSSGEEERGITRSEFLKELQGLCCCLVPGLR